MGWRFWRREPSEAEARLAELGVLAAPGEVDPDPDSDPWEHLMVELGTVTGLEHLGAEEPAFGLQVEHVEVDPEGTVTLGGAAEGAVTVGDVVGLLLVPSPAPPNATVAFDESRLGPSGSWAVAAALEPGTAHGTVVAVRPGTGASTELVVSGLRVTVPVGSVVVR